MNRWKKKQTTAIKPNKRPKLAGEGFLGRLGYFMSRAVINIRQNVFVNVVTIGTITLALLIVSLFLLVFVNLENAAENWSERVQVTVYFDHELAPQELAGFRAKINAVPGTARITYVSRDEALKRFKGRLRGQESLLEGVRSEVFADFVGDRPETEPPRDPRRLRPMLPGLNALPVSARCSTAKSGSVASIRFSISCASWGRCWAAFW